MVDPDKNCRQLTGSSCDLGITYKTNWPGHHSDWNDAKRIKESIGPKDMQRGLTLFLVKNLFFFR